MKWAEKGLLGIAFMIATDVAIASATGMVGFHGAMVDGGAAFGEAFGIPQLDWHHLWENWEIEWIYPDTDPCLAAGGHYHGSFCHVEDNLTSSFSSETTTLASTLVEIPASAPSGQIFTFE